MGMDGMPVKKKKKKQQNVRAQCMYVCMGLPACVTGMGMHMPVCHYRTVGSYVAVGHMDGDAIRMADPLGRVRTYMILYDTISLGVFFVSYIGTGLC